MKAVDSRNAVRHLWRPGLVATEIAGPSSREATRARGFPEMPIRLENLVFADKLHAGSLMMRFALLAESKFRRRFDVDVSVSLWIPFGRSGWAEGGYRLDPDRCRQMKRPRIVRQKCPSPRKDGRQFKQ